jgi:hypothetical protein
MSWRHFLMKSSRLLQLSILFWALPILSRIDLWRTTSERLWGRLVLDALAQEQSINQVQFSNWSRENIFFPSAFFAFYASH